MFNAAPDQVEVVIHPQSVIHSMVEYHDGSVLAQMGHPDMRTPIAYGLGWPERISSGVPLLDLVKVAQLQFEAPDEYRFPCLKLARQAILTGDWAPITLNAANEVAVASFLQEQIRFTDIAGVIEHSLGQMETVAIHDLDSILATDRIARELATREVERIQR
jgi:1-deoxy-D-xylulose-5-phosphate reductoisomerase